MMEDRSPAESSDGLRGRVAIVTGATNRIGRAFANGLLDRGMSVVACDIDECVHELDAASHTADVSQPDDVERVVRAALDAYGRIDVLVNNAGGVLPTRADLRDAGRIVARRPERPKRSRSGPLGRTRSPSR